jgi:thiol-disulfide isomerase/thioredoxin
MKLPVPAVLAALAASSAGAQTVHLDPLSTGAMTKMGGYMPQRLELSPEKPATLKKAPEGLEAPLYGMLVLGPKDAWEPERRPKYLVIVDEPDGKPARLFIDANRNGDLTDDPAAEWKQKPYKGVESQEFTQYEGGGSVELGDANAFPVRLGMYRFDKNDAGRAALKNVLLYYCDYAREGTVELGGKTYKAMLTDDRCSGDFRGRAPAPKDGREDGGEEPSGVRLCIDVNGNGKFDSRGERFDARQPFNIGGVTYEVADLTPTGDEFRIFKSSKTVAAIATPPDHGVGKVITAFKATKMDGKPVAFPSDYKGRVVLLDFWATWCGPCMMEMPNVVEAYGKFHEHGLEVLGISLDQKDSAEKVTAVTGKSHMPWPQVYDGKYWKAEVADLYAINSIPRAFLVDGDSGEILATGDELRGEKLAETIAKALAKKNGPS